MSRYDSEQTERVSGLELEWGGVESFGNVDEWQGYYALVSHDDGWSIIHESGLGFVTGKHYPTELDARVEFDGLFRQYCEDQAGDAL